MLSSSETNSENNDLGIALYDIEGDSEDKDNPPFVHTPYMGTHTMVLEGSEPNTYYHGTVQVRRNETDFAPSNKNITVLYKFWVKNGFHIKEGIQAKCRAWVDYDQYRDSSDYTIPHGTGPMNGSDTLNQKSWYTFVFSNINWDISMETVKGSSDDPVIVWQKNNYASYLLTIRNTSGVKENGDLSEDDWVPDTTTFSNYNIQFTLPDDAGDNKAYAKAWQFIRYQRDDDGNIVPNEMYSNPDNEENNNRTYSGKWIANDISNVGYDVSKYDERQTKFTISPRGEELYPPQFGLKPGKKETDEDAAYNEAKYEEGKQKGYKTERVYRIFTPFCANVKGSRGDVVEQDITYKAVIYIGGNNNSDSVATSSNWESSDFNTPVEVEGIPLIDDRSEEERAAVFGLDRDKEDTEDTETSEMDLEDTSAEAETAVQEASSGEYKVDEVSDSVVDLGYPWDSGDKNEKVYFKIPNYQPSGLKTVQTEAAYVGKKITYTISDIGIQRDKTGKAIDGVPMYRPNIVDEFPSAFDLEELQFLFPENLVDAYSKDGSTPTDFWLGGEDKLLGTAVIGDKEKRFYPILEYKDADGEWRRCKDFSGSLFLSGERIF